MKFSVIIPVYNVECYLCDCVNSVLRQTYEDYEILLVDDGSTDSSSVICDEYAKKDKRIRAIHKANGGLSSARNKGIKCAEGDFIIFLDSDDYWSNHGALFNIFQLANSDIDLICFGYQEYVEGHGENGVGTDFTCFNGQITDKYELLTEMLAKGVYVSSACCKAVRRTLILENQLFFKEGVTSEDIDWSARLLKCLGGVAVFPESFYYYRQRNNSIVHTIRFDNVQILTDNIIRTIEFGKDINEIRMKNLYNNYVSYQYITFLKVSLLCENDERTKELRQKMKEYRWLLNYHLNKKVKIVYWVNKVFGYNMIFRLLKIFS